MGLPQGTVVRVHYRGTLKDGTEFDSSKGRDPIEFTLGEGQVIEGFEAAVTEMQPGETRTVTIPADEAYGPRYDEAVQSVPREVFSDEPETGAVVMLMAPDGSELQAVVAEVLDGEVMLDFNHPLAGEELTFELELDSVVGGGEEQPGASV